MIHRPQRQTGTTRRTVILAPDAGRRVGFGHVGRCIALAQALRVLGWSSTFYVRDRAAAAEIRRRGFSTSARFDQATIGIVDSYERMHHLVEVAHERTSVVAAIDDLHQLRAGDVRWVIRPSLGERSSARVLAGPGFVLLRSEYWGRRPCHRTPSPARLLVTLGAHPSRSHLATVLRTVEACFPRGRIEVVAGPPGAPQRRSRSVRFLGLVPSVRPLLLRADLAVTAGGQTMYECLATGIPAIAVRTADNQARQLRAAVRHGAVLDGGQVGTEAHPGELQRSLVDALASASLRRRLSATGMRLVDGRGALRLARALTKDV